MFTDVYLQVLEEFVESQASLEAVKYLGIEFGSRSGMTLVDRSVKSYVIKPRLTHAEYTKAKRERIKRWRQRRLAEIRANRPSFGWSGSECGYERKAGK